MTILTYIYRKVQSEKIKKIKTPKPKSEKNKTTIERNKAI